MQAFRLFKIAADGGQPDAQFIVGQIYAVVMKNYDEAAVMYRRADKAGHSDAQLNLGLCYISGEGVIRDSVQAVKCFRRAADAGSAGAQSNLGLYYYNGNGVDFSHKQAVELYQQAAEAGHLDAQTNLGRCYINGNGVPQDPEQVVKWFWRAAKAGNAEAQFNLGLCYYNGNGVDRSHKLAVAWYLQAADAGQPDAQYRLGLLYAEGRGGLNVNAERAREFFSAGSGWGACISRAGTLVNSVTTACPSTHPTGLRCKFDLIATRQERVHHQSVRVGSFPARRPVPSCRTQSLELFMVAHSHWQRSLLLGSQCSLHVNDTIARLRLLRQERLLDLPLDVVLMPSSTT